MTIRFSAPSALATAALVLLAACADQPTAPGVRAGGTAAPAFTTSPSGARLISNAVRYSDTGGKPSTGRAGSAAISARALIGSDMVTELEVRAAPADSNRTAQASLQKVRVTATGYNGEQIFETNHNGLSGPAFTRTYTGLGWGQTMQVQANVTGIDANRTDVVNASVPVLLRPDLGVTLYINQRVRAGEPAVLTAFVYEVNGQVGASADCVLYEEGAEVDRSLGIWVDASGLVTCAFTHVFQAEGRRSVEVRVENVNPGDWSTGNNASRGLVQVVAADNLFYEAMATSSTNYMSSSWSYEWLDRISGGGGHATSEYSDDRLSQSALAYGIIERTLATPLTIHASQGTGGATVHRVTLNMPTLSPGYDCVAQIDGTAGVTFYVCTSDSTTQPFTSFRYERSAGTVTYHSADYGRYWDSAGGEVYTYHYNFDSTGSYGTPVTYGPDYTFNVQFVTPDTTLTSSLTVPLTYSETSAGGPGQHCSQNDSGTYFTRSCNGFEYRTTAWSGHWSSLF